MMKNSIYCLLLLIVSWVGGQRAYAQATASPHSLFGIGEVNTGNFGENSGMAGVGIGYMNPNVAALNTLNPAGNALIPHQTFIFDGSFYGKLAWYDGQGKKVYAGAGNISRLAFGFRAAKPWTISVGLTPYSAVGYNIVKDSPIDGTHQTFETKFTGEGGFNKLYLTQSLNISPKLSAGVNASLIFGTIRHKETSAYWYAENKSRGEKVYFDFGLQYYEQLASNRYLTVGAIYGYKSYVQMTNTRYAYDFEDTVAINEVRPPTRQNLPEFYGVGASISSRKMTLALDYLYQGWARVEPTSNIRYKNMNKVTFGMSYLPNALDARRYWQT
ncbi:MAG: hypothetical protein LUD68_02915, partial [Rikenellaceae bacterium]|nr:hypothetical protein [Rikenellaceae bacterium]